MEIQPRGSSATTISWIGIILCLVAPGIILWVRALGWLGKSRLLNIIGPEVGFWTIVLMLTLLVVKGERRGLNSIGVARPRVSSLVWGAAAAALVAFAFFVEVKLLDLRPPSSRVFRSVETIPLWLRIFILLTAGIVEEFLYRGYPIQRLQELTGSRWLAVTVPLIVFVTYHYPFLGGGHMLFVITVGAALTGLYLLRRDLWSNIVAHLALDVPFFLLPFLMAK